MRKKFALYQDNLKICFVIVEIYFPLEDFTHLRINFDYIIKNYLSQECYCGQSYGAYGEVDVSNCFIPCPGDKNYKCGGYRKNSIYTVGLAYSTKINSTFAISTTSFSNIQTSKRHQGSTYNNYFADAYSTFFTKKTSVKTSISNIMLTRINNSLTTKSNIITKTNSIYQSTNLTKAISTVKFVSTTKKNDISTSLFTNIVYNRHQFTNLGNLTDFSVTKITFTPRYYYKKHDLISSTNKNALSLSFSHNNLYLPELNISSAYTAIIKEGQLNNTFYFMNSTLLPSLTYSNSNDVFFNLSSSPIVHSTTLSLTKLNSKYNLDSTSKILTAIVPIMSITSSSFINNNDQSSTLYETIISENQKLHSKYNILNTTSSLLAINNNIFQTFTMINKTISNITPSTIIANFTSSFLLINSTSKLINEITEKFINPQKNKTILFQNFSLTKQNKNFQTLNETIDSNFNVDNVKTTNIKIDSSFGTRKTSKINTVTGINTTSSSRFIDQLITATRTYSMDHLTDEDNIYDISTSMPLQNESILIQATSTKMISFQRNISSITFYVSTFNGILSSSSTKKPFDLQDPSIYLITGFYNIFYNENSLILI